MKVKQLLPIIYNMECVRICKADGAVEWSGYAFFIPKKYYKYEIDKMCSFPLDISETCTYIFIK